MYLCIFLSLPQFESIFGQPKLSCNEGCTTYIVTAVQCFCGAAFWSFKASAENIEMDEIICSSEKPSNDLCERNLLHTLTAF